jgi:hypothetical protein
MDNWRISRPALVVTGSKRGAPVSPYRLMESRMESTRRLAKAGSTAIWKWELLRDSPAGEEKGELMRAKGREIRLGIPGPLAGLVMAGR